MILKEFEKLPTWEFVSYFQNQINNYTPSSIRRVFIPKMNGDKRPLGIPCMKDRIVQQCILQVLDPICEAKFYNHNYGFRPNRSQHDAIARLNYLINRCKCHYCVSIDIKGFFDNVNHAKLIKQMWTMGIKDKNLLSIITKILKAPIQNIGISSKGTPQGGVLSPLLSNIVLNELDWWISSQWESFKSKTKYSKNSNKFAVLKTTNLKEMFIVRFADDFKIMCKDSKTAFKILNAVKLWLKDRLDLSINPEKSKATNLRRNYTEFLGLKFKAIKKLNYYYAKSHIKDQNIKSIRNELAKQIKHIKLNKRPEQVNKLNSMIIGKHNYFKVATHICIDFSKISFSLMKLIYKHLEPINTKNHSKSFIKLYPKYISNKVRKVANVDIFPIYGICTSPPMSFTQQICSYTKYGRDLIHKQISNLGHIVNHLLNSEYQDSMQLHDNKISLIYQQKAKCAITDLPLEINEMHCHHIIPKSKGGTDEYKNLKWLNKNVHQLIHSTTYETMSKLIKNIKSLILKGILDENKKEKVFKSFAIKLDKYRLKVGNNEIFF